MRAAVYDRYGPPDVLRIEDVERPLPRAGEVLIKVRATTVNRTDCGFRSAEMPITRIFSGLRRPKHRILGSELSGVVETVGDGVSEFRAGDEVFGINVWRFGAHAEYVPVRASAPLAHKPADMSFEEAAALCDGAILALNSPRPVRPSPGKAVLVYGASGSIGTAGVQLSKYFGATVTAVCTTKDFDLMRSLGADEVIDYTAADFTKNGRTYDVIFDAVGKLSFSHCRGSLGPHGSYVPTDHLQNVVLARWTALAGGKRVVFPLPPRFRKEDVLFLKKLIEAGKYRAVIDRCYPLDDVVEATRYVETHQKTGNVVLTVSAA